MVMTKRVHNETSHEWFSQRFSSKTGFCVDHNDDSNGDEEESRRGDERDGVSHGVVEVVPSKPRELVDGRVGLSFGKWKTDCGAFIEGVRVGLCDNGDNWVSSKEFPCR